MLLAPIAALLTLAEPAAIDPPVEPLAPPAPATQPPDDSASTAPPPPTDAAPSPPSPTAETVDETDPAPPPAVPSVRPSSGLGLEFGYARGGDRIVSVTDPAFPMGPEKSLKAGDGVFFALAGSWMPYWSKRSVGLGVYARIGAKFVIVGDDNAGASFLRCPLAVGAQLLLPIVGRTYAVGRLGLITEVVDELATRRGGILQASQDFSPTLGQFIDAGLHWAATEHSGVGAVVRYERLDVSYSGVTASANNLGVLASALLSF